MFTGEEKTQISLEEFKGGTIKYRSGEKGAPRAFFYSKAAITELLNQNGAVGMRVYYALTEEGDRSMYIVATDCDGKDLRPSEDQSCNENQSMMYRSTSYMMLKSEAPCPTYCDDGQ